MTAQTKLFEIRDEGTTMVCIAIKPDPLDESERWCYARTGYGIAANEQRQYVLLAPLAGGEGNLTCDPYKHGSPRTLRVAHQFIIDMWHELSSGEVIDVQYIEKETDTPKKSEREEVLADYINDNSP
jgi:hypothetical protein